VKNTKSEVKHSEIRANKKR